MKILLATMQLTIGGAETHILDLAKELKSRGHAVTIVSAGGILQERAEAEGISCVTAPLNSTRPRALCLAYGILLSLIRKGSFDLIHAHARIPAFLCGGIARRCGIPMVTTAHYPFRVTPLLRRLTDWGDGMLAVSCHVKAYLMREYAIPEPAIALTVNGIDTSRFTPKKDCIQRENSHRLLHVSRLDPESDAAARALIRIAPRLKACFPDLTLTVVGDGKTAPELRRLARALPYVRFLGARTDIPELLNDADAFVGVSRAALEAMACGLPTVLSGNQGQLGLYIEAMEATARAGNFCCMNGRGRDSDERLIASVKRALSLSPAERNAVARINRETVQRHYSIARMADDAEALYARVLPGKSVPGQIVIDGYYGFGNCGDEALLGGIIGSLRERMPEKPITVLSADPEDTRLRYGVRAVHRYDPALLTELERAEIFLCGGGSLFTDITSLRSLKYYVGMLALAKKAGCHTVLCAIGIGPIESEAGKRLIRSALRLADSVSVRDRTSLAYIKTLAPTCKAALCEDPALLSPSPDPLWIEYLLSSLKIGKNKFFAVCLRPLPGCGRDWEERLASCIRLLARRSGKIPLFFVMHESVDRALTESVAKKTGGRVLPPLSGSEVEGLMSACAFALPIRLHAAILAYKAGIKVYCLSYDPKTEAFCAEHRIGRRNARTVSPKDGEMIWNYLSAPKEAPLCDRGSEK